MAVKFSVELFDMVCDRIADGESLVAICRDKDMPSMRAVFNWLEEDAAKGEDGGDLVQKYARARETSADADADKIKDIANRTLAGEYAPDAARVAIDAHKWSAGKRKPKVYGDKLDLNHGGTVTTITRIEREIVTPENTDS